MRVEPAIAAGHQWSRVAVVCGLCAVGCYLSSVVFKPLPWSVGRLLFFAFGPLTVASAVAFYQALRFELRSMALLLGSIFSGIAGVVVTLMAVVQDTQFTALGQQIRAAGDRATAELLERILWSVNVVQAGLDVSWDIFASVGTVLLAVAIGQHPSWGRIWGGAGILAGAGALILNMISFPAAPADAGLVDLGPAVGLWYGLVLIQLARTHWSGKGLRADQKFEQG